MRLTVESKETLQVCDNDVRYYTYFPLVVQKFQVSDKQWDDADAAVTEILEELQGTVAPKYSVQYTDAFGAMYVLYHSNYNPMVPLEMEFPVFLQEMCNLPAWFRFVPPPKRGIKLDRAIESRLTKQWSIPIVRTRQMYVDFENANKTLFNLLKSEASKARSEYNELTEAAKMQAQRTTPLLPEMALQALDRLIHENPIPTDLPTAAESPASNDEPESPVKLRSETATTTKMEHKVPPCPPTVAPSLRR